MAGPMNIVTGNASLLRTVKNLQFSKFPMTPANENIMNMPKVLKLYQYMKHNITRYVHRKHTKDRADREV